MRREDEVEEKLEWYREKRDDEDRHQSGFYRGAVSALEWVLTNDPLEERLGKRFETCPVKDSDCDAGPLYGIMLLAHMKEEHPEEYDAVTVDGAEPAD